MAEDVTVLPPSRIVRWLAIGVLIGIAVAMYFRAGTRLPPLTGTAAAAADSAN